MGAHRQSNATRGNGLRHGGFFGSKHPRTRFSAKNALERDIPRLADIDTEHVILDDDPDYIEMWGDEHYCEIAQGRIRGEFPDGNA